MAREYLFNILLVISFIVTAKCANILVLESAPTASHHIWIRAVTTALARHGHNITSISPVLDTVKPNNLHYIYLENMFEDRYKERYDMLEFGSKSAWQMMFFYNAFKPTTCTLITKSQGFKQLLAYPDDFKVDLVLTDFAMNSCLLGFVHKFNNPPLVALTAFNALGTTVEYVGSFLQPSIVPHTFYREPRTSFLGRVDNYLLQLADYLHHVYWVTPQSTEIMQPFHPGMPDLAEIQKRTKLVLMNIDFSIETPEPLLPNVIPVGGLHIEKPKPLGRDLLRILQHVDAGVIYFSLGSNLRSMDLDDFKIIEILTAFKKIPNYTFLWKFETNMMPMDLPPNVHIRPWFLQNDLLGNENTRLFITHGGLLSTQEATWHGVPMLGTPVFADQHLNMEKSIKSGVAEKYDLRTVNNHTFSIAILNMLNNRKYAENMRERAQKFRLQKETPLDRALWWIDWVLRHPNDEVFRNPALDMNIFQRQSIDVIVFLTIVFSIISAIIVNLIIFCFCKIDKKSNKVKTN